MVSGWLPRVMPAVPAIGALEHAAHLKGADAIIVPDNDEPDQQHGEGVATSLQGIAKRVRMLMLPDLPPKGDLSDWIVAGGTASSCGHCRAGTRLATCVLRRNLASRQQQHPETNQQTRY